MSHTHPHEAHHVKKGQHIMLKGWPCKIVDVKTSKTGKHGHAKCNITGIDVLTARKYNEVHPGHIVLAAFDQSKSEYEVTLIEDDVVTCMDADGGEVKYDLDPENEVHAKLQKAYDENDEAGGDKFWEVVVVTAPVGEGDNCHLVSKIMEFKEGKE